MEECYAVSAFWKQSMLFVKSVIDFLTEFILGALIMMRPKLVQRCQNWPEIRQTY